MGPVPTLEPIPRPPGHLLVGNLFDLEAGHPIESLMDLARNYGPIFELDLPGSRSLTVVSSFELVDPLCDESGFDKKVGAGLSQLASGPAGRGLFTSETQDPNWRKAHNVLLPAFSMDAMRGYLPRMLDIASQLLLKWERLNADDTVEVPADMTRLTLDTIALCGFDYRFNSFYRDTPHPFVLAMLNTLEAAQAIARELPIQTKLKPGRAKKVRADQEFMVETVRHIIGERRKSGALGKVNDLLDRMLTGVDRQSGEKLDETNMIAQCLTFLIAGHETTSGLLSFALYELIKKPKALEQAYEEVDRVLGGDVNALRPTPKSTNCPTCRRFSMRRCGSGRLPRPSPVAPTRTRSSAASIRSRRAAESWCSRGCCTATQKSGVTTPRRLTPTTSAPRIGRRFRPTPTSHSAPGSAPASAASSRCRRRRWS
jgi:cytochrome P450 / NADPH-cytochrome P450 reductase